MNRRFWMGKRTFVTGHTGFKGTWLCAWLLDAGADVAGFALAPSTSPSIFTAAGIARDMKSSFGDVRDGALLEAALLDQKPEVVFHLAAQPLVRASYERPAQTFETNVIGTAHLLDAVRAAGSVRAVVSVTSDKCYDPLDPRRRHEEGDNLGGRDPYSASKACAELVTAAYGQSFFANLVGIATARAGNVIGGGDWAEDRLVPDLVRDFSEGRVGAVRRPDAVRPWQHVLDPLSGYLRLAERLHGDPTRYAGAWNFGPPAEHEVTVRWIADAVARMWGGDARWRHERGEHPDETEILRLDSKKAAIQLEWRARVGLESAIAWTVEWYREFSGNVDARQLIRNDIRQFERVA